MSNSQKILTFSEVSSQNVEQIYDKYAPIIYGIISSLTDNVIVSEKIFTAIFLKVKDNILDFNVNGTVYPNLMRFTYDFVIQQLVHYGINPQVDNLAKDNRLTSLLCTRYESLHDMASSLNISRDEAKKYIRKECLAFNQSF